ncbi:MAG: ATP-binding cassette domain-containing protein [Propionibacteriaceae bacterium]
MSQQEASPSAETAEPVDYITATGLGLATRHGPVFSDLSFSFPKAALAVLHGPSGSGRSALLLAIGGRMRGLTGSLRVAGFDGANQTKQIRQATSIARISGLVDLEPQLTVRDTIVERALIDNVKDARAAAVFAHAETILDRTFDRTLLVDDLTALDRTLLAVALATLRPAHVLLLDDADAQLDLADQRELMAALRRVTDTGITVVASTLEHEAVPPGAVTFALLPRT